MKPLQNTMFAITAVMLLISCSTTEPPDIKPPVEPDSTTQNFTFETFEFGDGFSSSYLNDVWIFNENNIWAVGYISPSDTINGVYISNPNIIKWDGANWALQPYSGTSSGIYGIWAVDSSHIYFASGNIIKYKNNTYVNIIVQGNWTQGQQIEKLWGSSENNIWGVGPWGTIVHFDGTAWSKIDFDQQWYFYGITGDKENKKAYAFATNNEDIRIIVELSNSGILIIHQSEQITSVKANAINFISPNLYLAGSDFTSTLLWRFNPDTKKIDSLFVLDPRIGITNITGITNKDIYYWGDNYGENILTHYNGKRHKTFILPHTNNRIGGAYSIKDYSAIVGQANNKAYLIKVKRVK